jgi:uncharacterized membrane protein
MPPDPISSTGLRAPLAVVLAYSGWWVTGAIFWWLERRDRTIRLHAAQAVVVFGAIALLIGAFTVLAIASLSFLPAMFGFFVSATLLTWTAGVVLWAVAMWKAARGDEWRIPVAWAWANWLDELTN